MPADAAPSDASGHLLGNGDFAVLLTGTGAGYSRWRGLAASRWHAGEAGGSPGSYVYLRDVGDDTCWSATPRPCGGSVRHWFDAAMARYVRRDGAITTTLEVAIHPHRAVEVRGIGLRNDGPVERSIEMTSYVELVLGPRAADDAHPAYSKMFVQTAWEDGVLLAWRRKKDPAEPDIWAAHALVVDGGEAGPRGHETDRMRFIGRDGTLATPIALGEGKALSGTVGTVLDPIFSLQARVAVGGGETRRAAFVTAVGGSREEVLALVRDHATPAACAQVFALAQSEAPKVLAEAGLDAAAAGRLQYLVGALVRNDASWRASRAVTAQGEGGAPVLWARGISGDLPIVLAKVSDGAALALVQELARAQQCWRGQQLAVDIVVLDASTGEGAAAVAAALAELAGAGNDQDKSRGSLFVLRDRDLDAPLRAGLYTVADIVLDGGDGDLAARFSSRRRSAVTTFAPPAPTRARGGKPATLPAHEQLEYWNGLGGFDADTGEYVVVLGDGASTPAPWSHIVANPGFGFLVTASGGGYAWAVNSQQNQLTRWSNDAVCDGAGERFLLRDRDDGIEWSATPSPRRAGSATYVARFGAGHARFDANVQGIESELLQCVHASDAVKFSRLRLHNRSGRQRRLAVAQVVDWWLGPIGGDPRATTRVQGDRAEAAVYACNPWRDEFTRATAFIACSDDAAAVGSEATPRSAIVATIELEPGGTADVTFLLGEGGDDAAARALVRRHRQAGMEGVLADAGAFWNGVLGTLRIATPQRSLDLLANRCLPYQVLACRLWARTAFYQASGAYGFRDQLQDIGALCIARPDLARAHILLAASRQFEEGDVQHWWLPPTGKGVRTRIVDDRLWLPYAVAHYIDTTGDGGVLDQKVPFLRGDPVPPGHTDAFFAPARAPAEASLFEHCARAIEASLDTGVHGLPLMGTGDWNDGMNRVGVGGKGESVWMAWFLARVVNDFARHAEGRRDPRAARWRDHVRALQLAAETKAWDGAWYRRAFYDDGTPLGTAGDKECAIESMAQSWAVISGAADPERAARAMQAVNQHLVRGHDGLVALFSEPFDRTDHDPGYIKGYPPGLRENGGQYTHGSIWALVAYAMLGDGDKAGELLGIFDPIRKSDTPDKAARYRVEPYVECADVYSVAPHVGRGGWTWYSGSAGWLYRALVEWVLGFRLRGGRLFIEPCIPRNWKGFSLEYRRGSSRYRIEVENPSHACRGVGVLELDGVTLQDSGAGIPLADDGANHHVRVVLHEEPNR